MRNARGEFTEGSHFFRLDKLVLRGLQSFERKFQLCGPFFNRCLQLNFFLFNQCCFLLFFFNHLLGNPVLQFPEPLQQNP